MSDAVKKNAPRILATMLRYPVPTVVIGAVLLIGSIIGLAILATAIREYREDRAVEKLEQKADGAVQEADQAAGERQIEDTVRERTIKPEIERTSRNLEAARERTRRAKANYDQSRKTNNLGNDSDPRALHQRNCSDLRELYPGEPLPFCE